MSRLTTEIHQLLKEDTLQDLFDIQIYTMFDFVLADIKKLMSATNLSYKDALNIRRHIINKNSAVVRNGLDYYKEYIQKSSILPTGTKSLDKILGGGVKSGKIYEVCGSPASGKTQFCYSLAKNVIFCLNQSVYYLDTKNDFNPKRLKTICDADEFDEPTTVNIFTKLLIKRIHDIYDLLNALYEIKDVIRNGGNTKLIIIDSLPAVLYQLETPAEYNTPLNHVINILRFLTIELHVCVVVTNNYTTWYKGWSQEDNGSYEENIGCGKYWKHTPTVRLIFRKESGKSEINVTLDEIFKTRSKGCVVNITEKGLC